MSELVAIYLLNAGGADCAAIVDVIPGSEPPRRQAVLLDMGGHGPRVAEWLFVDLGIEDVRLIALRGQDEDRVLTLASFMAAFAGRGGRIEAVRWLVDRAATLQPLIGDDSAKDWLANQKVASVEVLNHPDGRWLGAGEAIALLPKGAASYRLFAVWPPGSREGDAAIRLAWDAGGPTVALFGGELDYEAWRRLRDGGRDLRAPVFILPRHGGPGAPDRGFGAAELAAAVAPKWALVPVGTHQELAQGEERRPHADLVHALREA
ncbi:MAG TPA: hypothetical protein VHF22_12780, partial [Planctomycetota bacterium]|nr:hypothetical protein [Planctomycetota bacterium]